VIRGCVRGIHEATPIILTADECAEVRPRRNTGCASGRGWCCWRRKAWPAARSAGKLAVRLERRRSGGVRYARDRLAGLEETGNRAPKTDRWLARHPNVHFHFTPTRASWLNQIGIWFSILADQSLAGASFTSVTQLRAHIDAFVATYNETPNHSPGPNPRSARNASKHVSRTNDSGY
jgi:DDE superfamily endonuclease